MPPQSAAIRGSSAAEQAGNNSGDNQHRDQRNPQQSGADEDQQHDRGEKADDQQQEREAERPDSADIDSLRAVDRREAVRRRRRPGPPLRSGGMISGSARGRSGWSEYFAISFSGVSFFRLCYKYVTFA